MSTTSITYNGNTIFTGEEQLPVNIIYKGTTLASLNYGQTKVLKCKHKVVLDDIHVGSKTLKCAGKFFSDNITVSVTDKIRLVIPSIGNAEYTGATIQPLISGYNSFLMTATGTTSATNVGSYTVTFSLIDKVGCEWEDGTTTDKVVTWNIIKRVFNIPSITGSFTYDGNTKSASITGFNSDWMNQSGTTSSTNAGTFTVTWSLKDAANSEWSDHSTTSKSGTWTIGKATANVSVSPTSYTFDGQETKTFTISNPSGGTLSASSSSSYFTPTVSGTTLSIKSGNKQSTQQTGTVTITSAESTNYFSSTCTVACTLKANVCEIIITGSGNTTYCYATIGGTKRYSAGTYTATPGSTITFGVYGYSATYIGEVNIDHSRVLTDTAKATPTYTYTIPTNAAYMLINMTYTSSSNSRHGKINVITSSSPIPTSTNATITVTGSGNSTYCYATINGTKQTAAGSYTAPIGSVITFGTYGRSSTYAGSVTIDGTKVTNVTSQVTPTTTYMVTGNATVTMSYTSTSSQRRGIITVTTA